MTDSPAPRTDGEDDAALAALGLAPGLFRRSALAHRLAATRRGGEPLRLASPWLRWGDLVLLLLALAAVAGVVFAAGHLVPPELGPHG